MNKFAPLIAAVTVFAAGLPMFAQSAAAVRVGTLACDASSGIGVIVASKKNITCIFTPSQPGPREIYSGIIGRHGRDRGNNPGAKSNAELIWAVVAPANKRFGTLSGSYSGAPASAGENALIGGNNRTVILLPVSLEGESNINLAAGVAALELRPAR